MWHETQAGWDSDCVGTMRVKIGLYILKSVSVYICNTLGYGRTQHNWVRVGGIGDVLHGTLRTLVLIPVSLSYSPLHGLRLRRVELKFHLVMFGLLWTVVFLGLLQWLLQEKSHHLLLPPHYHAPQIQKRSKDTASAAALAWWQEGRVGRRSV